MSDVNINHGDIEKAFGRFYTQTTHEFPSLEEAKTTLAGWHFRYDSDKNSITVFLTVNSRVELKFDLPSYDNYNNQCDLGGFKLIFTYCQEQTSWSEEIPERSYSFPFFDLSSYLPILNELKEVATKMDAHFIRCKRNVMSSRIVESLVCDSLQRTDIGDIKINHIDGSVGEISLTKIINGNLKILARANENNYREVLTVLNNVLRSFPIAFSDNNFFGKKIISFCLIKNDKSYEEFKSKFVRANEFNEDYTDSPKYLPNVRLMQLPKTMDIYNDFPELCQLFDSLGYNYGVLPRGRCDYIFNGIQLLCIQLTDDYGWAFYLTPNGNKLRMVAGKFKNNEFYPGNPSYEEVRYPLWVVDSMDFVVDLSQIIDFFNKMAKYVSAKDLYEYNGDNNLIVSHILKALLPKGFFLKKLKTTTNYPSNKSVDILFDFPQNSYDGISFKCSPGNMTELFDIITFLGDNEHLFKQLINIAENYPQITIVAN